MAQKWVTEDELNYMKMGGRVVYAQEGATAQGADNDQVMQLIQLYAQKAGINPEQLIQQLQQLDPEKQQEAIQKMVQELQTGQEGQEQNQSLQEEQQEMQGGPQMAMGGRVYSEDGNTIVNFDSAATTQTAPIEKNKDLKNRGTVNGENTRSPFREYGGTAVYDEARQDAVQKLIQGGNLHTYEGKNIKAQRGTTVQPITVSPDDPEGIRKYQAYQDSTNAYDWSRKSLAEALNKGTSPSNSALDLNKMTKKTRQKQIDDEYALRKSYGLSDTKNDIAKELDRFDAINVGTGKLNRAIAYYNFPKVAGGNYSLAQYQKPVQPYIIGNPSPIETPEPVNSLQNTIVAIKSPEKVPADTTSSKKPLYGLSSGKNIFSLPISQISNKLILGRTLSPEEQDYYKGFKKEIDSIVNAAKGKKEKGGYVEPHFYNMTIPGPDVMGPGNPIFGTYKYGGTTPHFYDMTVKGPEVLGPGNPIFGTYVEKGGNIKNPHFYSMDVKGPEVLGPGNPIFGTYDGISYAEEGKNIKNPYFYKMTIPGKDVMGPGNPIFGTYDGMGYADKGINVKTKWDNYRTKLNKSEEKEYSKWKSQLPERLQSDENYDLKGFFKVYGKEAMPEGEEFHLTDEFKLPNHPTFSKDSRYYNDETKNLGGEWLNRGDSWVYQPNDTTRQPVYEQVPNQELRRSFMKLGRPGVRRSDFTWDFSDPYAMESGGNVRKPYFYDITVPGPDVVGPGNPIFGVYTEEGGTIPEGYHRMPSGSLMPDALHKQNGNVGQQDLRRFMTGNNSIQGGQGARYDMGGLVPGGVPVYDRQSYYAQAGTRIQEGDGQYPEDGYDDSGVGIGPNRIPQSMNLDRYSLAQRINFGNKKFDTRNRVSFNPITKQFNLSSNYGFHPKGANISLGGEFAKSQQYKPTGNVNASVAFPTKSGQVEFRGGYERTPFESNAYNAGVSYRGATKRGGNLDVGFEISGEKGQKPQGGARFSYQPGYANGGYVEYDKPIANPENVGDYIAAFGEEGANIGNVQAWAQKFQAGGTPGMGVLPTYNALNLGNTPANAGFQNTNSFTNQNPNQIGVSFGTDEKNPFGESFTNTPNNLGGQGITYSNLANGSQSGVGLTQTNFDNSKLGQGVGLGTSSQSTAAAAPKKQSLGDKMNAWGSSPVKEGSSTTKGDVAGMAAGAVEGATSGISSTMAAYAKPDSKAQAFGKGAMEGQAAAKAFTEPIKDIPLIGPIAGAAGSLLGMIFGGAFNARAQAIKNEELAKADQVRSYYQRNTPSISATQGNLNVKYGSNIKNMKQRIFDDIHNDFDKYIFKK